MTTKVFNRLPVILLMLCLLLSAACTPLQAPGTNLPADAASLPTSPPPPQPSNTLPATSTQTVLTPARVSPTATLTPTLLPGPYVCSPLEDVTLSQLPTILSNPFELNRPGLDNGHHGADFAFYRFGSHIGMAGLSIYAVMSGKVAAIILNRPPYGNAVIIETPLASLPQDWVKSLSLPEPGPFVEPQPAMNCPDLSSSTPVLSGKNSLYLLYAHMQSLPALTAGDRVTCGQRIGKVGTTGESVNEHLHLETRIGPSSVRFKSMAYYDTSRTEEEAANYCIWRVSNIFRLYDPMDLLSSDQTSPAAQ